MVELSGAQLIETLGLEPHHEGGWYRRTFASTHRPRAETEHGPRLTMTSIFYMLTRESPLGRWHVNRSDILHFWQLGSPLHYELLHPGGRRESITLGPDLARGQRLTLAVPGGVWKGTRLDAGAFALISEAVAPGFEYEDMRLARPGELEAGFPEHRAIIEQMSTPP